MQDVTCPSTLLNSSLLTDFGGGSKASKGRNIVWKRQKHECAQQLRGAGVRTLLKRIDLLSSVHPRESAVTIPAQPGIRSRIKPVVAHSPTQFDRKRTLLLSYLAAFNKMTIPTVMVSVAINQILQLRRSAW